MSHRTHPSKGKTDHLWAGHITRVLAPLMQMAGFQVSVVDDIRISFRRRSFLKLKI